MLLVRIGGTGRAPQPSRFYINSQANPDRRPSKMTENQGPTESWELSRGHGSVTSGSCTQQQGRLDVHKTFKAEQTSLEDLPLCGRHS